MMDDHLRGMHPTLTTSILSPTPTHASLSEEAQKNIQALLASQASAFQKPANGDVARIQRSSDSTVNGVVIGLLSSFGSALLIAVIFLIVYFFRYTSSGRILLDRIGRPGEYDDEQQYAREEAEALEEMDDLQRAEYLRAKGMHDVYTYPKA
jgi:predicted PurR-regulated permease PerM